MKKRDIKRLYKNYLDDFSYGRGGGIDMVPLSWKEFKRLHKK